MKRGIFVTGTDTGVGKTLACCALTASGHAPRRAATIASTTRAGKALVAGLVCGR